MKNFRLIFVMLVLLTAVLPVAADSVWSPMDDYFFETWNPENESTCEYQERQTFMAAGEKGYVTSVRTPLDPTELKSYPNGTEFLVNFMCGIGNERWGTIRSVRLPGETVFTEDFLGKSGYIAEKDLVRAYDTDAFVDLNFNSIFGFADDFNPCDPYYPFVIWSYPNSGIQLDVVTENTLNWFCTQFGPDSEYFPIRVDRVYYEPNGNRWLSVLLEKPYTYGWINEAHPMDGAVIPQY